jgi:hypothetical protein
MRRGGTIEDELRVLAVKRADTLDQLVTSMRRLIAIDNRADVLLDRLVAQQAADEPDRMV